MSMKKLGKKGGFNEGTLVAFACACMLQGYSSQKM